jgi:ribosomal protein S17E
VLFLFIFQTFKNEFLLFLYRMGRIKSTFVKSSAQKIYKKAEAECTNDFDKNKEVVAKHAEIPSKRLRNSIVGYITRLVKKSEAAEE